MFYINLSKRKELDIVPHQRRQECDRQRNLRQSQRYIGSHAYKFPIFLVDFSFFQLQTERERTETEMKGDSTAPLHCSVPRMGPRMGPFQCGIQQGHTYDKECTLHLSPSPEKKRTSERERERNRNQSSTLACEALKIQLGVTTIQV